VALTGRANASFLARRLQHARFDAITSLKIPTEQGVSAGLVAFQDETHYYYVGVRRDGEEAILFIERANGKMPEAIATAKLADATDVRLKLVGAEMKLTFSYATSSGAWHALATDIDTTPITVQAAGNGLHFTGAVVGMYARIESAP
jgi:alpha-N-arabinofuranosidase